ncbi:MAG: ABC transporter substrate-binding protein [Desulfobacterales bacterium RIFOXYA12_FULL_46_15]|nr:MAG: ABC transporter substrate-binding protein [Desulfobacula sp. GWF2_41_7]OGR28560.1 MAG: ABC transporter substrate-binding protein [Desulfobacterales bacterium RIFOXYA12_FULL_46_15]
MKIILVSIFIIMSLCVSSAIAQNLPKMRISVENSETHVQTQAVKRFSDELGKKLEGRIDVRFFSNASLFRDKDIIQALGQGKVEMAVPGTWHVTQFEPNVGVFLLPLFYGRTAESNHMIVDGNAGKTINGLIEKNLHLKVVGRWIDLGHAHLFSLTREIRRHEDIQGLIVRVAGGIGNNLRISALGGNPIEIAWPDLPEYMIQGRVDAVLTSYETVRSAKLWEKGIKFAFEDQEYFPQYIPLIKMSFWEKLPPDIRTIVSDTWDKHVDASRKKAAEAQMDAKKILIENGVKIIAPADQQVKEWRDRILHKQNDFIHTMGIDPKIVDMINDFF